MAAIKSKYKRFNGVAWEEYYFETSVDQVIGLADFIKDNETKLSTNDSTATSGKYISRIQVNDHGLTITKADLPTGFSGDYNDLINKPETPLGTVTSIAMSVPTGLSISGSPITSSGTLALSLTNGYSIPTTVKQSNWDTAFGWGDHKTEGYVKTDTWKPNTDISEGYVTSGAGQVNKVWKTDTLGVPGWRDDDNVDTTYTAGTNVQISGSNVISATDTKYTAGTGLALSGTAFNHSNSVTAGSVSEGGITRTLAFGGTFNIPSFNYDAQGHLTGKSNIVLTMPANPNVNNYLTGVSGSGNGTVTFTRQDLSNLTWNSTHGHTIGQITNLQSTLDGKQPLDADLTSIAGLTGTSGLLRKTAVNTWGLDNTSYETTSNKKTTWGTPTNTEYPSSKLVKDSLDDKEPIIEEGTTAQYWRGDKTWQTLPIAPPTNLGSTHSTTNVTITSSTGNNATINGASNSTAGVVTTGTQTFKGNKTFSDNIVISGDLTVQGENFIANTTTLTTEDDVIELRSSGTTAITTPAGIIIKKYDGTNDGGIVIKNDGEVRVGKVETGVDGAVINGADQAQPVLTRDERSNLTTNRILMWSGDNKATNLGVGTAGQFLNHLHQWDTPVGTTYDLMTNTVLGLGKVFSNTIQTVAVNSVYSTASRTYGIQKNSSGQLVVNVPWSNTTYTAGTNVQISGSNAISATDTKYTAGANMSLSGTTFSAVDTTYTAGTNIQISESNVISATDTIYEHPNITRSDTSNTVNPGYSGTFTAVDSITSDAQGHVSAINLKAVTLPAAYSHPTHPGDDFSVDTGALTGATVVSRVDINVTTDTLGHVTDANGLVTTRTLTLADLGYVAPTINNGQLSLTTSGVGLSGSGTFTANQSGNSTFTVTSNATDQPTASTIVARDSSGDVRAASRFYYGSNAYTTYNSTDKSIDFVFTD